LFEKISSAQTAQVRNQLQIRKGLTQLFSEEVLSVLRTMQDRPFSIAHDHMSSCVPWELMQIDDWMPAIVGGLSRQYLADNLSPAKWLERRRHWPIICIL